MAVTDEYRDIQKEDKDKLFTELIDLKEQKLEIEKRIKELEDMYKPELKNLTRDLFFKLKNGKKFSIKLSTRVGAVNTKHMIEDGIDVDSYRSKSSTIQTFRIDK